MTTMTNVTTTTPQTRAQEPARWLALGAVAGLTERILTVAVLVWFVAMGWLAFRRQEP